MSNLKINHPENIGPLTVGRTSGGFCILDTRTNIQRTGISSRKLAVELARKQLVNERARARTEGRECGKCGRIHNTPEAAVACDHQAPAKEAAPVVEAAPVYVQPSVDAVISMARVNLAAEFATQCARSRKVHG